MRIQCNACETAEARVLCCADDAALCSDCDQKVHAANKLAGKHLRVPLLLPDPAAPRVPNCDICQEAAAYFFCLEDRALLCRKCDLAIHTANPHVSAHQRFLVTGVRVGLEPTESVASPAKEQLNSTGKTAESSFKTLPSRSASTSFYSEKNETFSGQFGKDAALATSKLFFSGASRSLPNSSVSSSLYGETNELFPGQLRRDAGVATNEEPFSGGATTGTTNDWPLDDFFGGTDFSQNYGFPEHTSSKADSAKLESSEGSPLCLSNDGNSDFNECFSQVPEISWTVPELPSPPTASGLHWQKNLHYPTSENIVSVPDICFLPIPQSHRGTPAAPKRRRAS